jgi:hypothetical protein
MQRPFLPQGGGELLVKKMVENSLAPDFSSS